MVAPTTTHPLSPIMPVDEPAYIYHSQLSSKHLGLALWEPKPVRGLFKDPDHVSIGDVGYVDNGAFMRMFNVTLPSDHPSNRLQGIPEGYKPLEQDHFENIRHSDVRQEEYDSHLSKVDNHVQAKTHAEGMGQTYKCWARSHGALLSLPHGARSQDVIRTKLFEDYIRDNVDSWFRWSRKRGFPVEHMKDLILVTGCTLASSWAAAVFDGTMSRDSDATTISLEVRKFDSGGAQFFWRNSRGRVELHHSDPNVERPSPENQCVFIRGIRGIYRFPGIIKLWHIVPSNDLNSRQKDKIRTRTPSVPKNPRIGDSNIRPHNRENSQNYPYSQRFPYGSSSSVQSDGSRRSASFKFFTSLMNDSDSFIGASDHTMQGAIIEETASEEEYDGAMAEGSDELQVEGGGSMQN